VIADRGARGGIFSESCTAPNHDKLYTCSTKVAEGPQIFADICGGPVAVHLASLPALGAPPDSRPTWSAQEPSLVFSLCVWLGFLDTKPPSCNSQRAGGPRKMPRGPSQWPNGFELTKFGEEGAITGFPRRRASSRILHNCKHYSKRSCADLQA
jgi:hypothetical protein